MHGDKMEKNENYKNKENTEIINDDPALRFDAFMGGVKDGGLRSVSSISILVNYIVANLNGKVTAEIIIKAMDEGMLANHFEISNAISKLIDSGTITEAEDGALSINDGGKASIELIEKDLPYTVRERSIKLVQKIIAKETYRRENEVTIEKYKDAYRVNMKIADENLEYLSFSMFAPSIEQAETIKERFITDPVKFYDTVINAIFANEE